MTIMTRARILLEDRIAPQIDAFAWYRHQMVKPFLISGAVSMLNVGSSGGVETLELLRRGNHVTTVEIGEGAAERTRRRAVRNGYAEHHIGLCGHILDAPLSGTYDGILMLEVLEHIEEDFRALQRLTSFLKPGGRLILSTPTASYGQLPGDTMSIREDGGHVRIGYDGPELDEMLEAVDMIPLRRIHFGGALTTLVSPGLQRPLDARPLTRRLGIALSFLTRPMMPVLEAIPGGARHPYCQLTLAVKRRVPMTNRPAQRTAIFESNGGSTNNGGSHAHSPQS